MGRKARGIIGVFVAGLVAACAPTKPPPPPPVSDADVLVVGDSVAAGLGCMLGDTDGVAFPYPCPGVPDIEAESEWLGGCSVSDGWILLMGSANSNATRQGACFDWRQSFAQYAAQYTPEVVVFLTGGFEIVDRWTTLPTNPGCTEFAIKNCAPGADRQWASANSQLVANARAGYRDDLDDVISLFRDAGSKVIVVNSAYLNPPQAEPANDPQVPPYWFEAYGPPLTANPPAQWTQLQANLNTPFGPSKTKIDNLNAEIADAVADRNDPDVQLFDLWDLMTPLVGGVDEYSDFICVGPGDDLAPVDHDPGDCASVGATAVDVRHPDGGHFEERGNQLFLKAILPQIHALLA